MKTGTVYLVLAIAGAIIPYAFFIRHFGAAGFGIRDFIDALFATAPSGGFTADLVISSLAFWVAMLAWHARGRGPHPDYPGFLGRSTIRVK